MNQQREVLVIGSGIAGCAAAIALAHQGVPVTLIAQHSLDHSDRGPCVSSRHLKEAVAQIREQHEMQGYYPPISEHILEKLPAALEAFFHLSDEKEAESLIPLLSCLKEQLQHPLIEIKSDYELVELITLDKHSNRLADAYRKPACLGAHLYHRQTHRIERWLAKETILALGGASSLFLYSTHHPGAQGQGLVMARQAGARLWNLNEIYFHPLALFQKGQACLPLPVRLLELGGRLWIEKQTPFQPVLDGTLSEQFYQVLQDHQEDCLWLDLSFINPAELKNQFPFLDDASSQMGINWTKELLPVVPAASYLKGGIVVDKGFQTTVNRLRAVGDSTCMNLPLAQDYFMGRLLEALAGAQICAEEIAKQIHKFVYYFPDLRESTLAFEKNSSDRIEDQHILKQIMWNYAGIKRSSDRLELAQTFLQAFAQHRKGLATFQDWQFKQAVQASLLLV